MKTTNDAITFTKSGISMYISKAIGLPFIGLAILFVFFVIRIIQRGIDTRNLVILLGSFLSVITLISFAKLIDSEAGKTNRGFLPIIIGFGQFIPYLFGCYLCFYEGIYRLIRTISNFTLKSLILSLLFTVFGYVIVRAVNKCTSTANMISDGKIQVI